MKINNLKSFLKKPKYFTSKKRWHRRWVSRKKPGSGRKLTNKTTQDLVKMGIKKAIIALVFAVILVLFFIILDLLGDGPLGYISSILFMMLPVFVAFFLLGNYFAYEINLKKVSYRTEIGEDINIKLEGLKNYIKEYICYKK